MSCRFSIMGLGFSGSFREASKVQKQNNRKGFRPHRKQSNNVRTDYEDYNKTVLRRFRSVSENVIKTKRVR